MPHGYDKPKSTFHTFKEGATKLRFLRPPISFSKTFDDGPSTRYAWPALIWGDKPEDSEVVIIDQSTGFYKLVYDLAINPDWGDPSGYDVTVSRTGSGRNTKYTVVPSSAKDLPKKLQDIVDASDLLEDDKWMAVAKGEKAEDKAGSGPQGNDEEPYDPFADEEESKD